MIIIFIVVLNDFLYQIINLINVLYLIDILIIIHSFVILIYDSDHLYSLLSINISLPTHISLTISMMLIYLMNIYYYYCY